MISVVGFDPSLRNWGIAKALINPADLRITPEDIELVHTKDMDGKRVRKNSNDLRSATKLQEAVTRACRGRQIAIAEIPGGTQSNRGAISNGICIGVLAGCPIPLVEVSPDEVKLATVGKKTASKAEMIEWATSLYPYLPWIRGKVKGKTQLLASNEHLADAVAVIHAGIQTPELRQALAMAGFSQAARGQ